MQSTAATVAEYLAELPADRRAALEAVRQVIRANLHDGYEEGMQYGMIGYFVPHSLYPAGYHCDPRQPLPFLCLASQKNYMSLYMSCNYDCGDKSSNWFQKAWAKTGKKLDMGKSCIRFRRVEDLALDVIGEAIRRMPVQDWIAFYEAAIRPSGAARAARKKPVEPASDRKSATPVRKSAKRRN